MHHLSESAGAVFAVLAASGDATRPRLARLAGLSKPTVSNAITELESLGLATRTGTTHGTTGRAAAVYRLGPAAGTVLAVDLGSTHTAVRACALDGTLVASRTTREGDPATVVHELLATVPGPVRAVVVAVPDVVRPAGMPGPAGAGPGGGTGASGASGLPEWAGSAGWTGALGPGGVSEQARPAGQAGVPGLPGSAGPTGSGVPEWTPAGAPQPSSAPQPPYTTARPATPSIAAAVDALNLPPDLPLHLENNVNCAALAELHEGAARGRHTFGYLQVGYGIGLGIVVGGHVLRGAGGAAGEIARLPYPWLPDRESVLEGMEAYVGAGALMRRVREGWRDDGQAPQDSSVNPASPDTPAPWTDPVNPASPDTPAPRTDPANPLLRTGAVSQDPVPQNLAPQDPVPLDAADLFRKAAAGHPQALRFVALHARDVGRLAAATVAVLDPGLIVLGGGIGANPQLLPGVRAELARLSWPTEVVSSEVGDDATVAGAARLAVARGIQTVTEGSDKRH